MAIERTYLKNKPGLLEAISSSISRSSTKTKSNLLRTTHYSKELSHLFQKSLWETTVNSPLIHSGHVEFYQILVTKMRLNVYRHGEQNRDPLCNTNRSTCLEGISFHQFLLDPALERKWIRAIRRDRGAKFTVSHRHGVHAAKSIDSLYFLYMLAEVFMLFF